MRRPLRLQGLALRQSFPLQLARFKQPKDIQVVDEIPHHVTGKVLRRVLRGEELLRSGEPEGDQQE